MQAVTLLAVSKTFDAAAVRAMAEACDEALTRAGVDLMYDCRKGECGLCLLDIEQVDGTLDHRDVFLSAHEKQENRRICACVSRVVGRITLDTAWRPEAVS